MPVLVAAMALLFTAWLSADGVPASEPQQLNESESLLTITETVEAPLPPAPKGGDVTPAPPPTTETEASPTTPAEEPKERKPAKDCDKQVTFTPLNEPDEPAAEEEGDEADQDCADEQPAKKKKKRHRRKSTEALFNKEFHPPAGTKWIVAAYNQGRILPLVPAWTEFNRIWNEVMAPVWNNAATVRSALTETHRQMQTAMAATARG